MYRKTKINTIMIVFLILIIVIGAYKLFDYYKGSPSVKSRFLKLDTSAITIIRFFPQSTQYKEIILYRNGENWSVKFKRNSWKANQNLIKTILTELININVDQVVTAEKSRWDEFGVSDNDGIRVKVEENNNIDAHFIIGKKTSSLNEAADKNNSTETYVRKLGENNVYAVSGDFAELFNKSLSYYRNNILSKVGKDNITRLTYIYNGDSSFVLSKIQNQWMIENIKVEQSKLSDYLSNIAQLTSTDFAENYTKAKLTKPESVVRIEGNNFNSFSITAFRADPPVRFAIVSTANDGGIFDGTKNNLYKKIFLSKKQLIVASK